MDVKVDVRNVLPGNHPAGENAAIWLREHLNIPSYKTVIDEFEKYFNCRISIENRHDAWMQPDKFVFETSADVTAFLLKWS